MPFTLILFSLGIIYEMPRFELIEEAEAGKV
jgi:hypothetical protein